MSKLKEKIGRQMFDVRPSGPYQRARCSPLLYGCVSKTRALYSSIPPCCACVCAGGAASSNRGKGAQHQRQQAAGGHMRLRAPHLAFLLATPLSACSQLLSSAASSLSYSSSLTTCEIASASLCPSRAHLPGDIFPANHPQVIARESLSAMRKNVLAKCYGVRLETPTGAPTSTHCTHVHSGRRVVESQISSAGAWLRWGWEGRAVGACSACPVACWWGRRH